MFNTSIYGRLLLDLATGETGGTNSGVAASEGKDGGTEGAGAGSTGETKSGGEGTGKETTPASVTEPTFDLDALKSGKNLNEVLLQPKKEETQKEVKVESKETKEAKKEAKETKVEDKKDDKKPTILSPFAPPSEILKGSKKETKEQEQEQQQTLSRDDQLNALGLDDSEKSLLKKVPNETFSIMINKLQKLQKLEKETIPGYEQQVTQLKSNSTQVPAQWYEHPQAYQLTPGFAKVAEQRQNAAQEYTHWRNQLVRIKAGEPWQDLEIKDGKYVMIPKDKPTTQDEVDVTSYMNNAASLIRQADGELTTYKTQFEGFHKQLRAAVGQAELQWFPDYNDKHPMWPVAINAFDYLAKNGLGDNILSPLVAKMYARLTEYSNTLKEANTKSTTAEAVIEDVKRAGPPSSGVASVSSGGKEDKILSMDMFK